MNQYVYPEGPKEVPPGLTRPSRGYAVQVWAAMAGVLAFVALYLSLCAWFVRNAFRSFAYLPGSTGDKTIRGVVVGSVSAVLAVFLVKGLFGVVRGGGKQRDVELTAASEPALFQFLHRLADETGAPRPHRVFVSPFVNAAVFYDLSLFNLIFPSRKNLEIGLGLVNALTLTDFKAVLAHEFGHFAQRSMAVGRYVYVAQQIAGHIVARRDWFDRMLGWISRTDIRVAWVGWILRLVVWSIRSLLDTAFSLVILAQRALSREMEFQADLVSVSVAGSDAIVHALHRLEAADEALDHALEIAAAEQRKGRRVADLFTLQSRVTDRMRVILDDESHGCPPALPDQGRAAHRVFAEKLAQAPRMWATHPSNREREENAKRVYVSAPLDERPAWALFHAPDELRAKVTASIFDAEPAPREPLTLATLEEAHAAVDGRFARRALQKQYRGAYLKRSPVLHAKTGNDLLGAPPPSDRLRSEMESLYPPELRKQLAVWRALEEEVSSLEALRDGILAAPGGVIRHRGRVLKQRDLPKAIEAVRAERSHARDALAEHDRRCRTVHRAAAAAVGQDWAAYLDGLRALYHYASHAEADVDDARGHFGNVLSVVVADGSVSRRERKRLVAAAAELYTALFEAHGAGPHVTLPPAVAAELDVKEWKEALPTQFELNPPSMDNIGQWIEVVGSWHSAISAVLGALRAIVLEELLETEARVADAYKTGTSLGAAPPPALVPSRYTTRVVGSERPRQRRLGLWDRFVTADGFFPALARLGVAAAILGPVVGFSGAAGDATVIVYNGLDTIVRVQLGAREIEVWPGTTNQAEVPAAPELRVVSRTRLGAEVEAFAADAANGLSTYVYNVAAAAPLVEWTAAYGTATADPTRMLGPVRWHSTQADYVFEEPPSSIKMKGSGATRRVLSGPTRGASPNHALSLVENEGERKAIVAAHAAFDDASSPFVLEWLGQARGDEGLPQILARRFAADPRDVPGLRAEQDVADPAAHAAACARHQELARSAPEDLSLAYVASRCDDDRARRAERILPLYRANQNHPWLAFSAGSHLADAARWNEAVAAFTVSAAFAPLKDGSGLSVGRLARLNPGLSFPASLTEGSPTLREFLALESGRDVPDGPAQAYSLLASGSLPAAVQKAEGSKHGARVLRLAAASDGAPRELVQRALALPAEDGLDGHTSWAMVGLALRERLPHAPFAGVGDAEGIAAMQELVSALAGAGDAKRAEAVLARLPMEARAHAAALGAVALGERAPAEWRRLARAVLFSVERPYLREP